jgi:hypothetical protein
LPLEVSMEAPHSTVFANPAGPWSGEIGCTAFQPFGEGTCIETPLRLVNAWPRGFLATDVGLFEPGDHVSIVLPGIGNVERRAICAATPMPLRQIETIGCG